MEDKIYIKYVLSFIILPIIIGVVLKGAYILLGTTPENKHTDNLSSIGFTISQGNNMVKDHYKLLYDDSFESTLNISHNFKRTTPIIITLTLNYKQIPFNINGKTDMFHKIYLEKDEPISYVPINFNAMQIETNSTLTININVNNEYHLLTRHNLYKNNTTLSKKNIDNLKNKFKKTVIKDLINANGLTGVYINYDKENPKLKQNIIECNKNELVEISTLIGGYDKDGNYLTWISVNNNQVYTNEDKLEYFNIPKNKMVEKKVKIKSPKVPGDYIIYGYSVANPFEKPDSIGINTDIEFSNKVTLRVK